MYFEYESCMCNIAPHWCIGGKEYACSSNYGSDYDPAVGISSVVGYAFVETVWYKQQTCQGDISPPKEPSSASSECNVDCSSGVVADDDGGLSCYVRKTSSCDGGGILGVWPHITKDSRYTTAEAERFIKENCVDVPPSTCKSLLAKYFNYGYSVSDRFKNWKLYNQRNYR